MKNTQKNVAAAGAGKLIPITVRLPESTDSQLRELSERYGLGFAETVRLSLADKLRIYLGNIQYIDRKQASEILKAITELTAVCRDILNNARRIGINYNQEMRLKNAKKKYHDILKNNNASIDERVKAKDEYDAEVDEIKGSCLNENELKNILSRFEAAVKRTVVLSWHIHE